MDEGMKQRIEDYRAGYSAGHSHGRAGRPMHDFASALRFFNIHDEPAPVPPPVDRTQREASGCGLLADDHRTVDPGTGQQKQYVVLSLEERAKGFVRPVRQTYRHTACGQTTTMARDLAETYARDPTFYSGTFCATCCSHFSLDQFTWAGTTETVGS